MFIIFIFPLFFTAKIATKENESSDFVLTDKTYSYLTYLKGLKYKQTAILVLLLVVFIYDLINCKVISINSGNSMGTMFLFIILLFICGYFNNTLIYTKPDEIKKNGMFSRFAINSYKVDSLNKDDMFKMSKEEYKDYMYRQVLKCEARFGDSSNIKEKFNFPAFNLATVITTRVGSFFGYK